MNIKIATLSLYDIFINENGGIGTETNTTVSSGYVHSENAQARARSFQLITKIIWDTFSPNSEDGWIKLTTLNNEEIIIYNSTGHYETPDGINYIKMEICNSFSNATGTITYNYIEQEEFNGEEQEDDFANTVNNYGTYGATIVSGVEFLNVLDTLSSLYGYDVTELILHSLSAITFSETTEEIIPKVIIEGTEILLKPGQTFYYTPANLQAPFNITLGHSIQADLVFTTKKPKGGGV